MIQHQDNNGTDAENANLLARVQESVGIQHEVVFAIAVVPRLHLKGALPFEDTEPWCSDAQRKKSESTQDLRQQENHQRGM